ncbi:MAG: portal protein [Pseudomonadota bacterium]|nr:portal protein [Pseudomonadota bacterium]
MIVQKDGQAAFVLDELADMRSARSALEDKWREITDYVHPMRAELTEGPNARRKGRVFDATPALAAGNLAAGLWGMVTNPANRWFRLTPTDPIAAQDHNTRLWLERASDLMLDALIVRGMRFYAAAIDLFADLVTYGTAVFYVEDGPRGLRFSCRNLAECYIGEDADEQVDRIFRRFTLTAHQAHGLWGDAAGPSVVKAMIKNRPRERFAFVHAVFPREDREPGKLDSCQLPFASVIVSEADKLLVREGGYHEFPFQVPRWTKRSGNVYGESPAMLALPDVKMLNAMGKTTIVAAQRAADPPLLAPDENTFRSLRTQPGGIIYGGMDYDGRRRVEPLLTGANVPLSLELEEQRRDAVREAFHFSLLMMIQKPGMTATEVLARQEERIRLMGPHLGRIQSEFLSPLVERVFGLLMRAGAFGPPPPALLAGPGMKIEYTSPIARAHKAGEANATLRALDAIAPLAAADPSVMDIVDIDAAARAVIEAGGVPPSVLRDPQSIIERRAVRNEADAVRAVAEHAEPVARAVKTMTEIKEKEEKKDA